MDDVEMREELRQGGAQGFIDRHGAERSADDHQDGLFTVKPGEGKAGVPASGKQLAPDGAAGEHRLFRRQKIDGLREVAADLFGGAVREFVGKPRRHVGFMDDDRDAERFRGAHDGYGYEPALGEQDVWADRAEKLPRFGKALEHAEGIGEVLPVEVPAELAGGNTVIGDPLSGHERLLDAFIGADIFDVEAGLPKTGKQGDVGRNVSGGAAAGQNDLFHN